MSLMMTVKAGSRLTHMDLATEPPVPEMSPEQKARLAWRKNAPHIYQTLITISTEWPSLTVQWLPEIRVQDRSQELVLGTRTAGLGPEYLRFGRITIPRPELKSLNTFDSEQGTFGTYSGSSRPDFEIAQRIDHQGEINRARYMPQNPNLVAASSSEGQIAVFDRTKFSMNPIGTPCPSIVLRGHKQSVFALDWSSSDEGWLLSASNDGQALIWDIQNSYNAATGEMVPFKTFELHDGKPINDAKWQPGSIKRFATCGDDKTLVFTDWVDETSQRLTLEANAYSLAFNPANEFLLAVGLENGAVELYDTRKLGRIHKLQTDSPHTRQITALEWNPKHTAILASGSADSTISLWDASQIASGREHRMRHLGHTAAVADLSWNPAYDLMIASTAEDNGLHIWEPVWNGDEDEALRKK